ncbi:MAG: hypothetical protein J0I07_14715 [Myxococcales bacterium]|nr:hypothetical protein [Myxococcales bacterium]
MAKLSFRVRRTSAVPPRDEPTPAISATSVSLAFLARRARMLPASC